MTADKTLYFGDYTRISSAQEGFTTKHKVSTTSFISSPLKHIPIIRHVCSLLALCEISPRLFESVVMNVLFPQVE